MRWLRRWWPVVAAIILMVVGGLRLRFDVEVLNLLPRQLPEVQGLRLYNEHFSDARELVVTVAGPDRETAAHAAQTIGESLRIRPNLVSQAHWKTPWQEDPGQLGSLLGYLWKNAPPGELEQLAERLQPARVEDELVASRERLAFSFSPDEIARLSFDPLRLSELPWMADRAPAIEGHDAMFASADGKFRLVFLEAASGLTNYRECIEWFDAIKQHVAALQSGGHLPSSVDVRYTGRPAFLAEISAGMQRDMTRSVLGTGAIVALLFWWAHRRWKPMIWLMGLLLAALGMTLTLGGLIYGALNVMSVGFAAILLGVAVDYGMVLYQAWRHGETAEGITSHTSARRGVLWSTLTTATAFLMLNLSGLPGLAQLGTIVAVGVLVGGGLILWLFMLPFRNEPPPAPPPDLTDQDRRRNHRFSRFFTVGSWVTTLLIAAAAAVVLWNGLPPLDRSPDSLRPRRSQAHTTLERITEEMGNRQHADWLLISGPNEDEVGEVLEKAERELRTAQAEGRIEGFTLPTGIWPRPTHQATNRPALEAILGEWKDVRASVIAAGFTSNALMLADEVIQGLGTRVKATTPWPSRSEPAAWALDKFAARTTTNIIALGLVYPTTNSNAPELSLSASLTGQTYLVGWDRLGQAMARLIQREMLQVIIPTGVVLIVCLAFAFRGLGEVLLSLGSLAFSLLALCTLMKLLGWTWNLMNMMAVPLLLGIGVDYSIHMQLALRRNNGDIRLSRESVGRALLLCAATTMTGFGSLALSSNGGLASLGKVCASGVLVSYGTATFLLPGWWRGLRHRQLPPFRGGLEGAPSPASPSAFYGAALWSLGLRIARHLPRRVVLALSHAGAAGYWLLAPHRRRVVVENLLPVVGDHTRAKRIARKVFQGFATKLTDLWRYESGLPIDNEFGELTGKEHLLAALEKGQGVLLVTPHLGNWEFGAPLLTRNEIPLHVVTLAEPDERLTELRRASRARWNIETVVIGNNPFGFVELIRRLEEGATVALLVDRPVKATEVSVELFGRQIPASAAPAELARATGCVILPVYIVREAGHYKACALKPIDYDRPTLRDPEARRQLTGQIMRAFEPAIRQYPEQWFHFVPVWQKP